MPSLQFREAHGQRAQVTGRTVKFVISDDNIAVTTMKVTAKRMWMTVMRRRILIFRPRAAASGEGLFALNYLLLSVPGTAQHGTARQGTTAQHSTAEQGTARQGITAGRQSMEEPTKVSQYSAAARWSILMHNKRRKIPGSPSIKLHVREVHQGNRGHIPLHLLNTLY